MGNDGLKGFETLSIGYGAFVTLIAVPLTLILTKDPNVSIASTYFLMSATPALSFFSYRTLRHGYTRTFTMNESLVALLSGLGLAAPLLVISLASSAIRGEYSTAERWMPEREDMETQIQRLVTELDLSEDTETQAMELVGEIRDKKLTKGREIDELSGAAIYIAARENDEPRTLEEIAELLKVSKRDIGKAYRAVARNTNVRIIPPGPADHIDRFADKLGLSEDVKDKAWDLLDQAEDKEFTSGKSHTGLAAAALYLAAHQGGEDRTLNETSDVLDITTVTIRERSKDFIRNLGLENYPEHFEESLENEE